MVSTHINSVVPGWIPTVYLPPQQISRWRGSTGTSLHPSTTGWKNINAWMLFPDYSPAFNTIRPLKLTTELADLGIPTPTHDWIIDFLTDRPQVVRMERRFSAELTVSTGTLQGCWLRSKLSALHTWLKTQAPSLAESQGGPGPPLWLRSCRGPLNSRGSLINSLNLPLMYIIFT